MPEEKKAFLHDINNSLEQITICAELMAERLLSPDDQGLVERIVASCQEVAKSVRSLSEAR
jgi:hypothetical protein